MKRIIMLAVLCLCGCTNDEREVSAHYSIVVIEGCEYIVPSRSTYTMIHKANCTNQIHSHNQ